MAKPQEAAGDRPLFETGGPATTVHDLLPAGPPDTETVLRGRAEELFPGLVRAADRDTLLMLTPLPARLALLAESSVANR